MSSEVVVGLVMYSGVPTEFIVSEDVDVVEEEMMDRLGIPKGHTFDHWIMLCDVFHGNADRWSEEQWDEAGLDIMEPPDWWDPSYIGSNIYVDIPMR